MKFFRPGVLLTVVVMLSGCAAGTTPVPPCCYQGPVTTTRLQALEVVTTDGRRLSFDEAFPGFEPDMSMFTPLLPFRSLLPEDIIYRSIAPLLPLYDANGDGRLEEPEILVMYAREAARALGTPMEHFSAGAPVWAVSAPTADVGGLVRWVEDRRPAMSESGQALFHDLELLSRDLRVRGSEGPDGAGGVILIR